MSISMKSHIVNLFYGLLITNILFILFLIGYDLEASVDIIRRQKTTNTFPYRLNQIENKRMNEKETENPFLNESSSVKFKSVKESNTFMSLDSRDLNEESDYVIRKQSQYIYCNSKYLNSLFPAKTTSKPFGDNPVDRITSQMNMKCEERKRKLILLYFHDKTMTDENLMEENCNVNKCTFSRKAEDYEKADAVLFKQVPDKLKRPSSNPNQLWIYYQLESPLHTKRIPQNAVMNWSATYRSDSTLPTPYGKFLLQENNEKTNLYKNYAKGKIKLVAWFVSNCRAKNGRFEYVRQLQKYIQVDIFGSCGSLKCPAKNQQECNEMLKRDYKFYLAFENSNCRDYISEKIFIALRNDVIPIAMGAHPVDYSKIAPPQSYIHVDQFKSPKELAIYLHILHNNDHLYNSYFRWKNKGEFMNTKFMCRLCAMVEIAPRFPTWYENINDWWSKKICLPANKSWTW